MPRTLRWGLAALALAGGAWLLARGRWSPEPPRRPLAEVAPESVVRLDRESGGTTLTLLKRADRWTAGGAPAKPELCEKLARGAQALTLTSRVDGDPQRYDSYGLGEGQGVRLRAWAEGAAAPALDVYLGRPAFGGVLYARLSDDAEIRLAEGLAPELLSLPATGYLLK